MALRDRARAALDALRGKPAVPAQTERGLEVGFGGTKITGGIINDDHLAALQGVSGIQTAAKMRRSSAQVRCTERVIGLPIRSAVWLVEEPKKATSTEKEAAELLRENLFGGMDTSWDALLREATLAVYFGFRVPEIVWEERAGLLAVKKIASRNPELLERWLYDEQGALVGYLYAGNRPTGYGLSVDASSASTKYERLAVPIEKTLLFSYESENENPQGFGLWRSMYKHWFILEALYKVLSVGIERNLLDVPVGRLNNGSQANDRAAFLQILSRWRAAEDAALVLTEGQELEFKGSNGSALIDAMPFLMHHDTKIAQAGLAAFLNLGQSATGTQALGTTLAKIFETSVDATAGWIEDTINTQLVRRWVDANYPPAGGVDFRAPRLTHKPIKSNDLQIWTATLSALMSGGLLHATVDDEEYVRDLLELPQIPREQLEAAAEERDAQAEEQRNLELLRLQGAGGAGNADNGGMEPQDEKTGATFSEPQDAPQRPEGVAEGEPWGAKTTPQPERVINPNRQHFTPEERARYRASLKAEMQGRVKDDGVS